MTSMLLLRFLSRNLPSGLERAATSLSLSNFHAPCPSFPSTSYSSDCLSSLQFRHYASSKYSSLSGRPAPEPWPVLAPIKSSPQHEGKVKLHNGVVRFPPGLQAALQGSTLVLSGRAGTVQLDLLQLDPVGLAAFKMLGMDGTGQQPEASQPCVNPLMLVSSPDKDQFQSVMADINSSIQGCMQGYLVGLTVKGVGYRLEPMEEKVDRKSWFFEQSQYDKSTVTYPHTKPASAIRLKVGFSKTIIYPLPSDVRAFSIKPTLLYLYGLQLPRLQQIAEDIRSIRKPNVYTGNGISLVGETPRLKQRSSRKK